MTEGAKLGHQLFLLRLLSGCTQEEVANALLISQSYLRQIEHGEANPTFNMVGKIVGYLFSEITGSRRRVDIFQLEILFAQIPVWRYHLSSETCYLPEVGWFPTYSIIAEHCKRGKWQEVGRLHDVSLDRETAYRIVELLNREQLSPMHLREAVESMLP